jgi:hypothetical protein
MTGEDAQRYTAHLLITKRIFRAQVRKKKFNEGSKKNLKEEFQPRVDYRAAIAPTID